MLNSHNVFYITFSEDHNLTYEPNSHREFHAPWFFKSPLYVPSNFVPDLDYRDKSYAFNLMLGSNKPFRTLTYKVLKDNKNIYSTYLGHPVFKNNNLAELDDIDVQEDLTSQDVSSEKLFTMNFFVKEDKRYPLSHITPEKIYANTHFDIVTETFVKQAHNFVTEKTAKPLATGRFFVWYNSNNTAQYLERYGFRITGYTGYCDSIVHDVDRLDYMLELVDRISNDDMLIKKIYTDSKSARLHNMNNYKMQMKNFYGRLHNWMAECLSN
jgi:hypothetical protein